MKNYANTEVSENTLEELIRHYASKIEEGLVYIDHQLKTDRERRLDVIMVDSGGALVVAELKVMEDDGMLLQGIDYYDFITRNHEFLCRIYSKYNIKPTEQPRLMFISTSFSISFLEKCKWLLMPVSLYIYKCVRVEGDDDIIPIFTEINPPTLIKTPALRMTINQVLEYITDLEMREIAISFLTEIKSWDEQNITIDPIQGWISLKYKGKVFAYLGPRRRFFGFEVISDDGNWPWITVKDDSKEADLENVRKLLKTGIDLLKS
jgi:hypothetical protein